jgi:DNA-binding MarR family transcriptional regulator
MKKVVSPDDEMNGVLGPDETIDTWLLFRLTRDTMNNARRQELARLGITPENSAVLHIIQDLGGSARPLEIARWTSRRLHSVHGLLERMERAGFVAKVRDPERKNGVRWTLTQQGLDLFARTSQLIGQRKILSALSKEQREQLRASLNILLKAARKRLGEKGPVELRPPTRSRASDDLDHELMETEDESNRRRFRGDE